MTDKELAEAHWKWLESILLQQLKVQRKLFVDAFIHGMKHGKEKK